MSLLAWYPLNGDTKDYSGNNNDLINNGLQINNEGKIGQCYKFDNDNYAMKANVEMKNIRNEFTICLWAKLDTPNNYQTMISLGRSGITIDTYDTRVRAFLYETYMGASSLLEGNFPNSKWTHIAFSYKNKIMSLYIDGNKVSETKAVTPLIEKIDKIYLGTRDYVNKNFFMGYLNDIRIYDEALTAMQIKEIAQAKICHYTCNEKMYENTVNLLNNRNQITDNGVIEKKWINDHHIEFAVEANTSYRGICLSAALAAKPLTKYTLSYKIQKIKGTLNRIRGHIDPRFNEISAKIDGISFDYMAGYNVLDNYDTHKVEVTISTKENITNLSYIYIQVNDTTNDYVKARVWDIQVEEKDHATPFTPNTRVATLKDISGFGYDMTSPVEYSPIWKNDEKKSYFELKDKANFYVDKPFSKFLKQFTISTWIKTEDISCYNLIGTSYSNNCDYGMSIYNGKLCLHVYTISSPSIADKNIAISNKNINDGIWHLATVSYDGDIVKTYIDGKLETQQNVSLLFNNAISTCFSINHKDISDFGGAEDRRFNGCVRDVRVYATALSDEDIKLLYQPEVIIDKANAIRCSGINEVSKTIKKHIEIKSKGFELANQAKVIVDDYIRQVGIVGWEVIEIKQDNTINVTTFATHSNNSFFVNMINHIQSLNKSSIVILATRDQPSGNPQLISNNNGEAFLSFLNSIGSNIQSNFPYRGAYAGIIYNGQIVKEEISYEGVNSSAEIILDELLIDSAILDDSTFNGFNKNATLNFKEFSEIPEIQSGVHNLKLGNDILPVLIDMDNDGGRWARIFYHNNHSGTVLFSNDNDWAEAKETNINNPTTSDKYSILSKLECFRETTNNYFEFRLKYPTDVPNECNIWKQKSNPTYQKVKDYYPIKISWNYRFWGGLEYSNNPTSAAFIDGSVNTDKWYYAIATYNKYGYGMPNYDDSTPNDVELWIRINDFDLFTDINQEIAINSKTLTAKEFKEIY